MKERVEHLDYLRKTDAEAWLTGLRTFELEKRTQLSKNTPSELSPTQRSEVSQVIIEFLEIKKTDEQFMNERVENLDYLRKTDAEAWCTGLKILFELKKRAVLARVSP